MIEKKIAKDKQKSVLFHEILRDKLTDSLTVCNLKLLERLVFRHQDSDLKLPLAALFTNDIKEYYNF